MLDDTAWALLRRLTRWLDQFKIGFGHRAQLVSLRQYVDGLFSDSGRKSMQAMLARVTEPASYQTFQHFITHAPWDAEPVWRRLRAVVPERRGVLILDETSFPKQGTHSVGVARQYCGALGKVANCQVAVTVALWTGVRAWLLGATLYLPVAWAHDPARRAQGAVSRPRRLPGEVAPRRDVAAARPRGGDPHHGGGRRRRIWRQQHAAAGPVALAPALCRGDLGRADPVSGHAHRTAAAARRPPRESARRVTHAWNNEWSYAAGKTGPVACSEAQPRHDLVIGFFWHGDEKLAGQQIIAEDRIALTRLTTKFMKHVCGCGFRVWALRVASSASSDQESATRQPGPHTEHSFTSYSTHHRGDRTRCGSIRAASAANCSRPRWTRDFMPESESPTCSAVAFCVRPSSSVSATASRYSLGSAATNGRIQRASSCSGPESSSSATSAAT